jgi:hypothetical protein
MALAPSPHPRAVYLMLKQAARTYLGSGTAATITITTITGAAITAPVTVAGSITVAAGAAQPASVSVRIMLAGVQKYATTAAVNAVTGAFSTLVPANTLTAGSHTATVSSTNPAATTISNAFTMT